MRIKITKDMHDIPERTRPRVGYIFDVQDIIKAGYKPQQNNIKYVECCGRRIAVTSSECEVIVPKMA